MSHASFTLRLPAWLDEFLKAADQKISTVEERMRFVIELSKANIHHATGGPFAAGIFRINDGSLFAAGVNLVTSVHCSVLHAEITALMAAQQKAGTHDLSSEDLPSYELVTSTEPCAMCLGAIAWSGIRRLVCGARGADAEGIGFDEGEKPPAWDEALVRRGISVVRDVCRKEAAAVLEDYRAKGGLIYNPGALKACVQSSRLTHAADRVNPPKR